MKVKVIGAGLAGCEAAWQLAERGFEVELCEMKPVKFAPAGARYLLAVSCAAGGAACAVLLGRA